MQTRVRQRFSQLQAHDERDGNVPWYIVNAAQSIDEVQGDINKIVEETIRHVTTTTTSTTKGEKPLGLLWQAPSQSSPN
jgi:hypothetical protein